MKITIIQRFFFLFQKEIQFCFAVCFISLFSEILMATAINQWEDRPTNRHSSVF